MEQMVQKQRLKNETPLNNVTPTYEPQINSYASTITYQITGKSSGHQQSGKVKDISTQTNKKYYHFHVILENANDEPASGTSKDDNLLMGASEQKHHHDVSTFTSFIKNLPVTIHKYSLQIYTEMEHWFRF